MYDEFEMGDYDFEETKPVKKVLLQILDSRGNIEDILFDINDIKKFIDNIYEEYPEVG